jgi:quinolinate synthase
MQGWSSARRAKECVDEVRARVPGVQVLVRPECRHEVVTAADHVGSTERIIRMLDEAPAGSAWAIGTELNLGRRTATPTRRSSTSTARCSASACARS